MLFKSQLLLLLLLIFSGSLLAKHADKIKVDEANKYSLSLEEKSEDSDFFYLTFKLACIDKSEPDVRKLTFSLMRNSVKLVDIQSLYPYGLYQQNQPALQWFMSKEQSGKLSAKSKQLVKAIVLKIKRPLLKEADNLSYSVEIEEDVDGKSSEKQKARFPISLK